MLSQFILGLFVLCEISLLQKVVGRSILITSHHFIKVKEEERCLWQVFLGQHWLISLFNLLKIEDGLPFGVRLIAELQVSALVFFRSADLFLLATYLVEFLSYEFLSHIGAGFVFLILLILSIEIFVGLLGLTHFMKTW